MAHLRRAAITRTGQTPEPYRGESDRPERKCGDSWRAPAESGPNRAGSVDRANQVHFIDSALSFIAVPTLLLFATYPLVG